MACTNTFTHLWVFRLNQGWAKAPWEKDLWLSWWPWSCSPQYVVASQQHNQGKEKKREKPLEDPEAYRFIREKLKMEVSLPIPPLLGFVSILFPLDVTFPGAWGWGCIPLACRAAQSCYWVCVHMATSSDAPRIPFALTSSLFHGEIKKHKNPWVA